MTSLLALTATLSSCALSRDMLSGKNGAAEQPMAAAPTQPAAEGKVEVAQTKNGNTSIEVRVEHLAQPQKLSPPASTYVVWARPDQSAPPQNMGALAVDDNLTGTLTTVTPHKTFEIFITPEESGQASEPSGERQLWASVGR